VGVAAAYTITDVLFRLPALWWWAGREGPVKTMDMCKIAAPFVVSGVAAALVLAFIQHLGALPPLARIILSGAASYGVVGATLWLMPTGRAIIRETLSMVMELIRFRRPSVLKA
jgi:PST family polysaccharide transporter